MFGINDNNQNTNVSTPNGHPADGPTPLPPSPFIDGPSSSPHQSVPDASTSAPVMPDALSTDTTRQQSQSSHPVPSSGNDAVLVNIKEQALSNLAPLVGHLDQTPEEKFKTTMMLIQASDNSSLVKEAYEAANQISDEKTRAQALLDVVNEINYFTQKDSAEPKT